VNEAGIERRQKFVTGLYVCRERGLDAFTDKNWRKFKASFCLFFLSMRYDNVLEFVTKGFIFAIVRFGLTKMEHLFDQERCIFK